MTRPRIRKWVLALCILLFFAAVLFFADRLLRPKYRSVGQEGLLTAEYDACAGETHQVLFLGDCEVYESFTPPTLWRDYGITSYIRGNAQQLIWQSYYLLRDVYRRETPEVVVFNVYAMRYGEPQNDAYNRMTLDGMRWSTDKVAAIRASMTEDESFASYVFPLLRFHSRWKELSAEDFSYLFGGEPVSHNGYLMQTEAVPKTDPDDLYIPPLFDDASLPDVCWDYLDRIASLCREHGSRLILIKAPTNSWGYHWYDEWDEQIVAYADRNGLPYFNFIPLADEIWIDWSTDSYDGGVHLNVSGAEKLTDFFGAILRNDFGLADQRGDPALAALWQDKLDRYLNQKGGPVS